MKPILAVLLALTGLLATTADAWAQRSGEDDAFILVATADLDASSYRRSVILVLPTEGDRHIGVVLNRPSKRTLADLFPEHEPSKQITGPVYFGGPMSQRAISALVHGDRSPGLGALRVTSGLFLALTASSVDRVIEEHPPQARFFVGLVLWRPGELREELGDRYWTVMDVHPDLLFRQDTRGLWEELSRFGRDLSADAGHALARTTRHGAENIAPLPLNN